MIQLIHLLQRIVWRCIPEGQSASNTVSGTMDCWLKAFVLSEPIHYKNNSSCLEWIYVADTCCFIFYDLIWNSVEKTNRTLTNLIYWKNMLMIMISELLLILNYLFILCEFTWKQQHVSISPLRISSICSGWAPRLSTFRMEIFSAVSNVVGRKIDLNHLSALFGVFCGRPP